MTIAEIFDGIRRLVLKLALEGKTTKEIDVAVGDYLEKNGLERETAVAMQKQAEAEWISKHLLDEKSRNVAEKLVKIAGNQFARIDKAIQKNIVETVKTSRKLNESRKQLHGRLTSDLKIRKDWAYTIANTSKAGFATASTISQAEKVGINKFRYDGPGAQRPFCIEHLDKTYSLSEIKQMDNGQGLPVLYYCGGYNCVHMWTAVE